MDDMARVRQRPGEAPFEMGTSVRRMHVGIAQDRQVVNHHRASFSPIGQDIIGAVEQMGAVKATLRKIAHPAWPLGARRSPSCVQQNRRISDPVAAAPKADFIDPGDVRNARCQRLDRKDEAQAHVCCAAWM